MLLFSFFLTNRREANLDKEASVSGFSKEIQEFNEHFNVGKDFNTIDENSSHSDNDEDEVDDEGDEFDDEVDDEEEEEEYGEEDNNKVLETTVKELSIYDEVNKTMKEITTEPMEEEIAKLKQEVDILCKEMKEETSTEIHHNEEEEEKVMDKIVKELKRDNKRIEKVEEAPSEVSERHRRKKGKDADRETRMLFIKQLAKARELRQHCEENGEEAPPLEDMIDDSMSDIHSVRSFSTTASTIQPEDVKRRTQRDLTRREKKQVAKKNLRVKGEANAYRRSKLANQATIKESSGWDEY